MRIAFCDSTAIVASGPGSPAFFSRYAIDYLKNAGHDVIITNGFFPDAARAADAVVTEWCNEDAFEAAASGLCKRLIVRLRGYDAFMHLEGLEWSNVDALVYESPFLKQFVEERFPGLRGFRSHVIPSGVDVANIPFKERGPGPIVAMVARGIADKGYQLAWEWARTRPDIQLHAALAQAEPRLWRYLEHTKPANVTMYGQVETVKWLDEINTNFLLSASHWESLGYTIAEAMACGVRPLIHDTPGAAVNWPTLDRWPSLPHLNLMVHHDVARKIWSSTDPYDSRKYRAFIEEHLDAAKQSAKLADLITAPPTRTPKPRADTNLLILASQAIAAKNLPVADSTLTRFRAETPATPGMVDHRVGLALELAGAYFEAGDLALARTWALRSMSDELRPEAACVLGEIAMAEDDLEGAERWYRTACTVQPIASHYTNQVLLAGRFDRIGEIQAKLDTGLKSYSAPPPDRYLIVVAVRNAAKYIKRCLESVKAQTRAYFCVVVDDNSTDDTFGVVDRLLRTDDIGDASDHQGFTWYTNYSRLWSLQNIVTAIRVYDKPGDVVIILDGDDQLVPNALRRLDEAYRSGAWMTYGNFVTSTGKPSWMPPYPLRALQNGLVRDYPWRVSHPKTFRKELFDKIVDADFQHDGKWFQTAGDVALMLPMLEMAAERAVYIPDTLYVYNDENDLNDHKVDPEGQVRVRDLIYAKPRRKRLEKL